MDSKQSLEEVILKELDRSGSIKDTRAWAEKNGYSHELVVGSLNRLSSKFMIVHKPISSLKVVVLSQEAEDIVSNGSPEAIYFNNIPSKEETQEKGPMKKEDLDKKLGAEVSKIGFSQAMKSKWIAFDSKTGLVTRKVDTIDDQTRKQLETLKNNPSTDEKDPTVVALKKRKLVDIELRTRFEVEKGDKFALEVVELASDLTFEMISAADDSKNSWKNVAFKDYNFNSLGTESAGGYLHPLMKVRNEFREIFLEFGFEEMPTNMWVESSFWNFDALFQPQQHPARDAHDTFFISDPAVAREVPQDYMERVKKMHTSGGDGSYGWMYDWKLEEAKKNILRTHTTAVSSRMLYKLAQDGFKPKKYFSIDRVFRNEALDATHLAEFHQIEGMIADYNLTLGNLMGIIKEFFARLGMNNLRFKPAYNPYTEPSMEVFAYHDGLKKWVEVGNSGMFRPEMLLPMGLPPGVRVIAWGLSLERPTMIKYALNNIRDLVGHKVDMDFVRHNPICRLDK